MRKTRRIAVIVATLAGSLAGLGILGTASPADAYYCGKLDPACRAVCEVGYKLGFQCVD